MSQKQTSPASSVPVPKTVDKGTLWFLYCVARFSLREIESFTTIDQPMLRTVLRAAGYIPRRPLVHGLPDILSLGVFLGPLGVSGEVSSLPADRFDEGSIRACIRDAFRMGKYSWDRIDAILRRVPDFPDLWRPLKPARQPEDEVAAAE